MDLPGGSNHAEAASLTRSIVTVLVGFLTKVRVELDNLIAWKVQKSCFILRLYCMSYRRPSRRSVCCGLGVGHGAMYYWVDWHTGSRATTLSLTDTIVHSSLGSESDNICIISSSSQSTWKSIQIQSSVILMKNLYTLSSVCNRCRHALGKFSHTISHITNEYYLRLGTC